MQSSALRLPLRPSLSISRSISAHGSGRPHVKVLPCRASLGGPPPGPPPPVILHDLTTAFAKGKVLHAAIVNRLPDVIAAEGRPLTPAEVARLAKTDEDATSRLLRTLAAFGVLTEAEDETYGLSPVGQLLVSDKETGTMSPQASYIYYMNDPITWDTWHQLPKTIKEGGNGWDKGPYRADYETVFDYNEAHPDRQVAFDRAMGGVAAASVPGILQNYDGFAEMDELMDVGGGQGAFIKAITTKYSNMKGINLDTPQAIENALQVANVRHVAGDFFKAEMLPKASNIIMKSVLHDWSDEDCIRILDNCKAALPTGGKLLIVEFVIPNQVSAGPAKGAREFMTFLDIQMMMMTPGGRERTEKEWRNLLSSSGLEIKRIVATGPGPSVIEAVKA